MKKKSYFIFFTLVFFCFSMPIFASKKVIIDGDDVRFRSKPTTNSNIIDTFTKGVELMYLETGPIGDGCDKAWYKVKYGSTTGYVCSQFALIKEEDINIDDYKDYEDYLLKLGFPESYHPYLINLHNIHPNWDYRPFNADITFNNMIIHEYKANGRSLIEDTGSYRDGYKSVDNWSYNYLTNVFYNHFEGGGNNWYAANKETIAYYLDPRNFLNEKQIFMFEPLTFNESYHTKEGIELALSKSFMALQLADQENNLTYIDAFYDAAKQNNISPYFLISRVIQEIGINGSTIVSGNVSGYEGYYNFYNINAAGNGHEETIKNGLEYAKKEGWNTPYKAIVGGSKFITSDYTSNDQNTLYLQKWDLFGPNYGNHQYMQNIEAPAHESIRTYNSYNNIGLIDSKFTFSIPVFLSMPNKTSLPNVGNPNNYLSSLSVNGSYLFKEPTEEKTFNLNLDTTASSIDIAASKVSSKATITGTGSISLQEKEQTIPIIVTAENGSTRTYNINITRTTNISLDISEILRTLSIKNDGTYIYGISIDTNISTIADNIKNKEERAIVTTFDKNGKEKTNMNIASGDIINIKTDREEKNYKIAISGDVNYDGKITASDYVTIKNHIMDVKKLTDEEKIYADVNKDGKITALDYVTIKNHIMDVKKIVQ